MPVMPFIPVTTQQLPNTERTTSQIIDEDTGLSFHCNATSPRLLHRRAE